MTLAELKSEWADFPEFHKAVHEHYTECVNNDLRLNDHRTYIENRVFGMGERSFWWLWKLLLEELPENPKLLEIGVFKGATMSLWKLLRPDSDCYGVTPLDGRGTGWTEDDYFAHITNIHHDFGLQMPTLYVGGSAEPEMVELSQNTAPYTVVYVDGDHSEAGALSDLVNYAPMVDSGGWLVIDDAACRTAQPWGYFQGIQSVCDALATWERSEMAKDFEFQFNVVHLMCYKRK